VYQQRIDFTSGNSGNQSPRRLAIPGFHFHSGIGFPFIPPASNLLTEMSEEMHVVTSTHEKWRYECPNGEPGEGHTNWFPINGVFRCKGCSELRKKNPDIDPEYEELRDKKTGEIIPREQITLDIDRPKASSGT